jgi:pyruvate formate-lyase activating enzyme-like uncharacterized protein
MGMTDKSIERVLTYSEIADEYINRFKQRGVIFAAPQEGDDKRQQMLMRLRKRGALFRNGDASIHINNISSACIACTGDEGSRTFLLSVQCHRHCYFCFNPPQSDYEEHNVRLSNWRDKLNQVRETGVPLTHIALTGGEPLIHREEMVHFFAEVRKRYPDAHMRLYTSGDLLDTQTFKDLASTGLTEIRFSLKLDDPDTMQESVLEIMNQSKEYIPQVMVEMPVMPGTKNQMENLLRRLDQMGIFGINLLEFGFPLNNWDEFAKRGFKVKNPPFEVFYDYSYAGGLPIWGSELLALQLLEFAIDESLSIGVHYCSLANKHRDQILTMNRSFAKSNPVYQLDENDYFLKSIVVFNEDREKVRAVFNRLHFVSYVEDPSDCSLQFSPRDKGFLKDCDVDFYLSYNVVEDRADGPVIRELKLDRIGR